MINIFQILSICLSEFLKLWTTAFWINTRTVVYFNQQMSTDAHCICWFTHCFFAIFPMFFTFCLLFCAKGIEIVIKHRDGICCTFAPFFAPFFGTFLKTQSFVPQVLTQVVNLSCYLWRHKESFIWSKLARLCKNEQKELGVLQSRLLFLGEMTQGPNQIPSAVVF